MKYTINDVRNSYTSEKESKELKQKLLGYIFYRKPSFYMTPIFLRLSVSANVITYLSFIILIFLPLATILNAPQSYVIMAIACFLFHCFDYIDGNIARTTNTTSKYGRYMDSLSGNLYWVILYVSFGMLACKEFFPLSSFSYYGLLLGFVTALLHTLSKVSRFYYKMLQDKINPFFNESKQCSSTRMILSAFSSMGYLDVPFLLVASCFRNMYIFLFLLFLFECTIFVYSQYTIMKNLKNKGD